MSVEPEDQDVERAGLLARARHGLGVPRFLIRVVTRDPRHVPERLTIYAVDRQADAVRTWAERTRAQTREPNETAQDQLRRTITTARLDGAISGTPFFIALVPAYIGFLQQELRLHLRVAALYGKDPGDPGTAAEFLVLKGIHEDVDAALTELEAVRGVAIPPAGQRTPIKSWYQAVVRILVFAGFLGAPEDDGKKPTIWSRVVEVVRFVVAGLIWAITWILPLTFMALMSWSCESDARRFGHRVLAYYGGPNGDVGEAIARADRRTGGNRAVNFVRGALVFVSVALPLALVVGTISQGKGPLGVTVPAEVGALAALALVIGVTVTALRG